MVLRRTLWGLMAMLIAPASGEADSRSLRFEMLTGVIYDGGKENYPDRAVVNLAPRVRFNGSDERYRADLSYSPSVRLVATQNWSHAWTHDLSASAQYAIGRLTTLDVNDRYQDQAIFDFGEEFLPDGTVDVAESASYDRVERNFANVSLQHFLSPRWVVSGSVSHGFSNFDEADQTDSETLSASFQVNHTWSRRTTFGLGVSGQYSVFDESSVSQGEQYSYLQLFASWRYGLNDNLRIEFQGGPTLQFIDPTPFGEVETLENVFTPAFVFRDYAKCADAGKTTAAECADFADAAVPVDPITNLPPGVDLSEAFAVAPLPVASNPDGNEVSVTFFGNISLIYDWDDWVARAYLARRESNASGEGSASSVTSAGFSLGWEPTPKWDLALTFGWSLRQTLGSTYGISVYGSPELGEFDATLREGIAYGDPVAEGRLAARGELLIAENNREFEITQVVAGLQVARTLTEGLTLNSNVSFLYQDTPRSRAEATRLRVTVNLVYLFPEWNF